MPHRLMALISKNIKELAILWVELQSWLGWFILKEKGCPQLMCCASSSLPFDPYMRVHVSSGCWMLTFGWVPDGIDVTSSSTNLGRFFFLSTGQSWWVCTDDCDWSSPRIPRSPGIPPGGSRVPGIALLWPFLGAMRCLLGHGQKHIKPFTIQRKILGVIF